MTHPLALADPGLASQAQNVKPEQWAGVGWMLVKDAVGRRQTADDPVWGPLYGTLANGSRPGEELVAAARAELARRHVDQLALRAELAGSVPALDRGMAPSAFTVATFAQDTWRLRALLALCEEGWDKERMLDLVHCLVNAGVERDALSAKLGAPGA